MTPSDADIDLKFEELHQKVGKPLKEVVATEGQKQEADLKTIPKGEAPKELQKTAEPIALDANGMIKPVNQGELYRYCKMLLKSRLLPEHFNSEERIMLGYQTLTSLGLEFLTWARFTAFVHGTFMVWGDLPLHLVLRSPRYKAHSERWLDQDYLEKCIANKNLHKPTIAAVCRLEDKDGQVVERFWTVDDAKRAGKWGKNVWASYPDRMLQMRARGWAIKDLFPDILQGVPQREYDDDQSPQMARRAPAEVYEADLNQQFESSLENEP